MCDKENCNCGSNPCCGDCEPWNCIEQAVNDVWATKEDQIEGLVDRAETAAVNSEASAKASADSAAEAKECRDEAETAATTAVAAEGIVVGVANSLQDTADKLKQIADELGTAIAGISVVTWYYTAVSDNQTVIPVPTDKNQVDVQAIFIEGARQEPNRGFSYDALNKEITLAEGIPLGMEIAIIIGTYSDNPNDFANTLASDNGASLIGTSSGQTVQQEINTLKQASGNFSSALDPILSRLAAETGLPMVGTFEAGVIVNTANQSVGFKAEGKLYTWAGTLPKTVVAGSTPATAGGIAIDAWVEIDQVTLRSQLESSKGSNLISYTLPVLNTTTRTITSKFADEVSIKDFGAVGDGITDDSDAIQAAIEYAESLPQLQIFPYTPVSIYAPPGVYIHSKPLRVTQPIHFVGRGVEYKAVLPFTPLTINVQGGGTETYHGQFLCLNGVKNADSSQGQLRSGLKFSEGILLNANDVTFNNIYMERFTNAHIGCTLQNSAQDALIVGPSCWGLTTHVSIENFYRYAIHLLDRSAVNGAALHVDIWGNFKVGSAGILFDVGSACNGVTVTGYIEKVDYGIIAARSTGALLLSGVDFEQCTNRVLQASSDGSDGLTIGRITFKGCYLHSIGASKIYAERTEVVVEGCTMHQATADYETDSAGTGHILADNNDYLVGYAGVVPGSNVDLIFREGLVREDRIYQPVKSTTFADIIKNHYQFKDSPNTLSSYIKYQNMWNGTDSKYDQESTWAVSDYYPSTSLQRWCGVTLSTIGSPTLKPIGDNVVNLGLPSARYLSVFSTNGVQQTSDERQKNVEIILDKEIAIGMELAKEMIKFTWKDKVDTKQHFGCSAQKVILTFAKNGLIAEDYGVITKCPLTGIYSVNYAELQSLCIAALASKLI